MKKLTHVLMLAGVIAGITASTVSAQDQNGGGRGGRGNFDPAQFRQRMMDGLKEKLEVKDDAEWKAIEAKVGKVYDAERELRANRMSGMGSMMGGRSRGGDTNSTSSSRSRSFFGEASPEVEALKKAIDAKASEEDIAAKLEKVRVANKAKEGKLESAQEDLKKLLTPRQEAIAVTVGLLK